MARQPEVEAAVREAIGTTYQGLGHYAEAERQLRAAIDRQPAGRPAGGGVARRTGSRRSSSIRADFRAAIPIAAGGARDPSPGPRSEAPGRRDGVGRSRRHVSRQQGTEIRRSPSCASRWRSVARCSPANDPDFGPSLNNLAFVLWEKGDMKGAEAMFREALDIERSNNGNDHPEVATRLVNLSVLLMEQRRYDAAIPLAREAVAIRRKILGNDHPTARWRDRPLSTALWETVRATKCSVEAGSARDRAKGYRRSAQRYRPSAPQPRRGPRR